MCVQDRRGVNNVLNGYYTVLERSLNDNPIWFNTDHDFKDKYGIQRHNVVLFWSAISYMWVFSEKIEDNVDSKVMVYLIRSIM